VRDPINRTARDRLVEQPQLSACSPDSTNASTERHWDVASIALLWNLSKDTVRRMFQNEPGVLVLGGRSNSNKRGYVTLRVPQSVLERVHARYSLVSYEIMI
jgi:hypothetical protein